MSANNCLTKATPSHPNQSILSTFRLTRQSLIPSGEVHSITFLLFVERVPSTAGDLFRPDVEASAAAAEENATTHTGHTHSCKEQTVPTSNSLLQ